MPAPSRPPGWLLVATEVSVISPGTERSLMEIGRASLVGKARARPDLARKVIESARTEGVMSTYSKVRGRLGAPNALGYSLCGRVLEADPDFAAAPGDLVACAGAGYAAHAEVVTVPRHLCVPVPDGVQPEDAAYTTVAAIALHGFRLAETALGDVVAVIGLGLVGQLALEIVAAAGCVPLGLDPDPERVKLAEQAGFFATADDSVLVAEAARRTGGRGADGVLVCAASKSPEPLQTGVEAARERAVICIVGDVPVEASRTSLFAKEVRLVVSRSYGPGRYDPSYELDGHDYPAAYVRWTEGRNLEEALRLMAAGSLRPSRLTSHTFEFDHGSEAYDLLGANEPSLGIVLTYPPCTDAGTRTVAVARRPGLRRRVGLGGKPRVGVVGAGQFARGVLLPHLAGRTRLMAVATATGISARASAERFGAARATTDPYEVLTAEDVDAVVIATRHDTHAEYVTAALGAGKHVFVEKPLALDLAELKQVEAAAAKSDGVLMVGFNRRFAPLVLRIRDALGTGGPCVITYRVNAGRLPRSHWLHDPRVGGGRIVGEACHFVDTAMFLAGGSPSVEAAVGAGGGAEPRDDVVASTLSFSGGSVAQIVYSALGDSAMPKERIEVLSEHGAAVLDDFRSLELHRGGQTESVKGNRDKGHRAGLDAFLAACQSGRQPWPVEDMAGVMRATFAMRDRLAGTPPQA